MLVLWLAPGLCRAESDVQEPCVSSVRLNVRLEPGTSSYGVQMFAQGSPKQQIS